MAKAPKKDQPKIELDPDAWPRFERLLKAAAKVGPKHRGMPKKRGKRKAK